MRSRIFGALCLATFTLTSAAYLSVYSPNDSREVNSISPDHRQAVGPDQALFFWPWDKEAEKAVALAAVGWKDCDPCKKLKKETLAPLLEEGYNVGYSLSKDWNGPKIRIAPTLFYLNQNGKIIRTETGFKTYKHVKKYLRKP